MLSLEFHTTHNQVKPSVLDRIREKLTRLHDKYPQISYVEIFFRKRHSINGDEKVCELDLFLFGEPIFIQEAAESFDQASQLAVTALETIAIEKLNQQKLLAHTEIEGR